MQWETLTSTEFRQAVEETGICVMALGVLERHSEHLPLGTDVLNGHRIACLAAEREPAIVFPPFYFGQIYEARPYPGTLTIRPRLLLELFEDVFRDICRNGIRKILLLNAHGGNSALVKFLAQAHLAEPHDYALYAVVNPIGAAPRGERRAVWDAVIAENWGEHAHESETSVSLANHPELVKLERVPARPARPLGRAEGLGEVFTGANWYADYPDHYAGDARHSTPEKGEKLRALLVDACTEHIRRVKQDQVIPGLLDEIYRRSADPHTPS